MCGNNNPSVLFLRFLFSNAFSILTPLLKPASRMGMSCELIVDPSTSHGAKGRQGITVERSNMNRELKEIKGALGRLERQIRKEYKAEIIGLFGSYVRGEQKGESDVDVLVRFLDGATLFDFVGLGDFLEERLSLEVDIVSERALRPELREQILKDVVSV